MNISIPHDATHEETEQELSFPTAPHWSETVKPDENAERFEVVAADDDLDDFDEDDFDDEFDDDFEEELEDEYELSEFEDVTEEDLAEGDDDLDTLGGDFVDEDAEPEEAPAADEEAGGKDAKDGKEGKEGKDAKAAKDGKKKGKAKSDDDEDFDED